jgi:alpha-ketoglutarate-dependent taurine dioxygenase
MERDAAIERFMDRVRKGAPLGSDSKIRQIVAMDIPDELTDDQLEAWLELSGLIEDDSFVGVLHAQHEPFKSDDPAAAASRAAFAEAVGPIIAEAASALHDGCDPNCERVRALVVRWVSEFARGVGRRDDAAFRRWLVDYSRRTNDPRIQRFWELVATMKGRPASVSPFVAAQQLLIDGLEAMQS